MGLLQVEVKKNYAGTNGVEQYYVTSWRPLQSVTVPEYVTTLLLLERQFALKRNNLCKNWVQTT